MRQHTAIGETGEHAGRRVLEWSSEPGTDESWIRESGREAVDGCVWRPASHSTRLRRSRLAVLSRYRTGIDANMLRAAVSLTAVVPPETATRETPLEDLGRIGHVLIPERNDDPSSFDPTSFPTRRRSR